MWDVSVASHRRFAESQV